MTSHDRNVCVFCGSRRGHNGHFVEIARDLGRSIANANLGLVYGAGDHGLMGEVAHAAKDVGGRVTGFIPRHLLELEVGNHAIDALIVTETMHERKKMMFSNSDIVVALPGGPGTLDELIEVLTWRHLGLHHRTTILLNADDYWGPLLALLDHMRNEGFVDGAFQDYLTVVETVEETLAAISDAFS